MKSWKKLLAMFMALIMVFALVACSDSGKGGKDDDEEEEVTIVGTWSYTFDAGTLLTEQLNAGLGDIIEKDLKLDASITYEFKKNGECTYSTVIEEDDFDKMMDDVVEIMVDYLYDMAEENDMTKEELEDVVLGDEYNSLEEYCRDTLEDQIDKDDLTTKVECYYKFEDDVIYIFENEDDMEDLENAGGTMTAKLSSKELEVTEFDGDAFEAISETLEAFDIELPMKFKKAKK